MKVIRNGVFETNSSSTHSICVTKNNILNDKLNKVYFVFGEFGWEHDVLEMPYEKASYLYTAIVNRGKAELIENIRQILETNDIEYEFVEKSKSSYYAHGYIDHGEEIPDEIFDICKDENRLMRFLFSRESFIITGNDNSFEDVGINVDYDHDEYYKGN